MTAATPQESAAARSSTSAWPYRLAWATVLAAVPLLVFGGTVTTLEAGMAIDGWWILDRGRGDHFLLTYPVEKWFRDVGTFVEHTHRLFGTLVGLLAIATLVATLALDRRRRAWAVSVLALVAVCVQGALGGFRVLENSPQLAFVHGAFGQLVFAVLAASAVYLSPRWREVERTPCKHAAGLHRLSLAALLVIYATIFVGAWLRHSGSPVALALHVVGVFATTAALVALARKLRATDAAGAAGGSDRSVLKGVRIRLHALLGLQVLCGLVAFWIVYVAVGPTVQEVHQSVFPTLHVLLGALLLAQTLAAAMWSRRVVSAGERAAAVAAVEPSLGGAS